MVKTPIIVKDYLCPIESTRKQLMKENSSRFEGKKFCFKKYITEKERVKKYLDQRKSYGELYDEKNNFIPNRSASTQKKKKKEIIYEQPKMRFKPRTEFERIVDSINEYNYNKINSELIRKQLKNMDLHYVKKKILKENQSNLSSSLSETSSSYDDIRVKPETKNTSDNINTSKMNFYKSKSVLIDNSVAKQLMREYHYKTHFKAAAALASKYCDENTKREKERMFRETKSLFSKKVYGPKKKKNYYDSQNNSALLSGYNSLLNQFANKFPLNEENFDLVQANPLLYNLSFTHLHNDDKDNDSSKATTNRESKLQYLRKLIYSSSDSLFGDRAKKVKFTQMTTRTKHNDDNDSQSQAVDLNKEDLIWVNNEMIPLSQIDLIAKKVLKNCNYVREKSINNNGMRRKGDGKLMVTSGLTVSEFKKRYQL